MCFFYAASAWAGVRAQLREGGKLYNEGKYGQALSQYVQAARTEPDNAQVLFNAGTAYYQLKDYANAQKAFQSVLTQNASHTQDAAFNLGNAYYRAGDKQNAIKAFQTAILQNPQDKEAVHNLQLILQEQNSQNGKNQNDDNTSDDSKNQTSQDNQDGKGQAPQKPQQEQSQPSSAAMNAEDARRVMQMAKENEYKRPASAGEEQGDSSVEKDW